VFVPATEQAAGDAGTSSWTGWAVTSLTSKLYKGGPDNTGSNKTVTAPATGGEGSTENTKTDKGLYVCPHDMPIPKHILSKKEKERKEKRKKEERKK